MLSEFDQATLQWSGGAVPAGQVCEMAPGARALVAVGKLSHRVSWLAYDGRVVVDSVVPRARLFEMTHVPVEAISQALSIEGFPMELAMEAVRWTIKHAQPTDPFDWHATVWPPFSINGASTPTSIGVMLVEAAAGAP